MRGAIPFGRLVMTGLISVTIALLMLAAFFALNANSLGRDIVADKAAIRAAFAEQELGQEDWKRGDSQIGQHQFNDCLILAMAVDQRGTLSQLTVSPSRPGYADPKGQCAEFAARLRRTARWHLSA